MESFREDCVFCDPKQMRGRIIRISQSVISIVSQPSFRDGQCLVIPREHVSEPWELDSRISGDVMREIGRLGLLLDQGGGYGVLQKYQPRQSENGVKMNHLHFHVVPRDDTVGELFPVPTSFDDFSRLTDEQIRRTVRRMQQTPTRLT